MSHIDTLALEAADQASASELHGVVCGLLTGRREPGSWIDSVLALMGEDAVRDDGCLLELVTESRRALRADDMRFMPVLADDDAEIEARLEQLGLWCSGFLAGCRAAGAVEPDGEQRELLEDAEQRELLEDAEQRELLEDAEQRELLEDLAAIAQVEAVDDGRRDAEADYAQLCEFVKVATLLLACPDAES